MKHFTAEEWVDFANELVAVSQKKKMDRHLAEGCSRCKRHCLFGRRSGSRRNRWRNVSRRSALYALQKQGLRLRGSRVSSPACRGYWRFCLTAFCSRWFKEPIVGLGNKANAYRAEPYQVDLQIEAKPGANKLVVTGQLLTCGIRTPLAEMYR